MPLPHWRYWFSRWIHLRTYSHLLLYELSSPNFFFPSYRWCFLYLLIFLCSYGLPVQHLFVMFWPNSNNTLEISKHEKMDDIIIFYVRNTWRCYSNKMSGFLNNSGCTVVCFATQNLWMFQNILKINQL